MSSSASKIISFVVAGLFVDSAGSSFLFKPVNIDCTVGNLSLFSLLAFLTGGFRFALETGKSLSLFLVFISGPLSFSPSLKWQLHTRENCVGSLSFLLKRVTIIARLTPKFFLNSIVYVSHTIKTEMCNQIAT